MMDLSGALVDRLIERNPRQCVWAAALLINLTAGIVTGCLVAAALHGVERIRGSVA